MQSNMWYFSLILLVGLTTTFADTKPINTLKPIGHSIHGWNDNTTYCSYNTEMTWAESNDFCKNMGMQLATLPSHTDFSPFENDAIAHWVVDVKRNYWQNGSDQCLAFSPLWASYVKESCSEKLYTLCEELPNNTQLPPWRVVPGPSNISAPPSSDPEILIQSTHYQPWIWFTSLFICTVTITSVVVLISISVVRRAKQKYILTKEDQTEFFEGITTTTRSNNNDQDAYLMMKYNAGKFEMQKNDFQLGDLDENSILGQGNYGSIYKVRLKGLDSEVAVKVPRDKCSRQTIRSLLCEIKIMSFVGDNDNVIKFLGAYTKEIKTGVLFIVTELCTMGSLQTYLQKMGTNTENYLASIIPKLFRFCFEIASGMQFISEKGVIHGDLAARNVLLDSNSVCKITDFGLSRKLYQYQVYTKKQQEDLPWRWLAIETLKRLEFSTKSDVWSYGVTLWEIFSFGDLPYPGISWNLNFVVLLSSGMRLTKPEILSPNVYSKMVHCWNPDASCRPNFDELTTFFSTLITKRQYVNCTDDESETDSYSQ